MLHHDGAACFLLLGEGEAISKNNETALGQA